MKKKTAILLAACALAIMVAAGAGIGRAYAYFTTYVQAKGTRTITLGDKTTIKEDYGSWQKDIRITNDADSSDAVYVRAKAFAGSAYKLDYAGDAWIYDEKEDFWVYNGVVAPGKETEVLSVIITDKATGKDPVLEEEQTINVVVVYETTPAVEKGTGSNGNIQYEPADWSRGLSATETEEATSENRAEGGSEG